MMAYQIIYPYTNEVLRSYESLSDAGVEKALEQAYGQYQAWQKDNDIETRKAVLRQVAALLRRDLDRYAETMTKDMGKLFGEPREKWRSVPLSLNIMRTRPMDSWPGNRWKPRPAKPIS